VSSLLESRNKRKTTTNKNTINTGTNSFKNRFTDIAFEFE
jgi:hypothetical protein